MVKKLFKHEALSYVRTLSIMYTVLLGIALLSRIVQLFGGLFDTWKYTLIYDSYESILNSTYVLYVLSVIAVFGLTFVLAVSRFYKNLFTCEGYLSFTLPVTPTQHVLVKLCVAVLAEIASAIVFLVSFMIISWGDYLTEIFKAIKYEFGQMWGDLGANLPFFVIYVIILSIVGIAVELLLIYGCIAIGQMSNKNRILTAVGVYFGYYAATQVIGSLGMVFLISFFVSPLAEMIGDFIVANPVLSVHLGFIIGIIISALVGFVYFTVTRIVIKKRLNLE